MSNLALSGRQFESHTQKTWKKQQGGNAQQCIQGYIFQKNQIKKRLTEATRLEQITRGRQSLIVPLPVLVVLVMVP